MAIKDFIENTAVFTRTELLAATGNSQTNLNLLSEAVSSGRVRRVTRNVYASDSGRYRAAEANPYLVADKLGEGVVFNYSSALNILVGLHNVTGQISLYSDVSRKKTIEFLGKVYIQYPRPEYLAVRTHMLPSRQMTTLTDKEQTIVDCLAHPERCGGLESFLRSISALNFIDSDHLLDLVKPEGASVKARCGWLLDTLSTRWSVSSDVLDQIQAALRRGPYYFEGKRTSMAGWVRKWHLYLPAPVSEVESWLE